MADLNPDDVHSLLTALGLEVTPEDLPEVTHRINALQEALGSLESPELDAVETLPIFWLQEEA